MTEPCPKCGAAGRFWEPATRTCYVCGSVRVGLDDSGRCVRLDAEVREQKVDRIADIIDPPAFAILSPWDKPVDERARIEERQIVARKRAARILDYLEGEKPQ